MRRTIPLIKFPNKIRELDYKRNITALIKSLVLERVKRFKLEIALGRKAIKIFFPHPSAPILEDESIFLSENDFPV